MGIPVIKMATIGILPSFMKRVIYRMQGAKIGKGVKFAPFSIISAGSLEIGDHSKFGLFSFINVKGDVKIGTRVKINSMVAIDTGELEIGDDSVIMEQTVVGGMMTSRSRFQVGKRVKIFPYCFINPTEEIIIGDDVGVGGSTYIFTHGTWKNVLEGYPAAFGKVHIKDRVWLPWRVFIMPGVTIGEDVIVAASSTITRSVPARSLARGTPATVKEYDPKPLPQKKKVSKLKSIFEEFVDFENYADKNASLLDDVEGYCFQVTTRNEKISVCHDIPEHAMAGTDKSLGDVVISLNSISEDTRKALRKAKIGWFDLTSYETDLADGETSLSVLEFLGRYGIRFDR